MGCCSGNDEEERKPRCSTLVDGLGEFGKQTTGDAAGGATSGVAQAHTKGVGAAATQHQISPITATQFQRPQRYLRRRGSMNLLHRADRARIGRFSAENHVSSPSTAAEFFILKLSAPPLSHAENSENRFTEQGMTGPTRPSPASRRKPYWYPGGFNALTATRSITRMAVSPLDTKDLLLAIRHAAQPTTP